MEAIEENPQSWLEYANALQKQEEVINLMLRVAASTGDQEADVTEAYTDAEKGGIKKMKIEELWCIGTSNGVVSTE